MRGRLAGQFGCTALRDTVGFLDSYASLLVLLLANFFLLELINDPRWGALGSTLLSAAALVVAISDPAAERTITRPQLHGARDRSPDLASCPAPGGSRKSNNLPVAGTNGSISACYSRIRPRRGQLSR
jgi:hypothetical protein